MLESITTPVRTNYLSSLLVILWSLTKENIKIKLYRIKRNPNNKMVGSLVSSILLVKDQVVVILSSSYSGIWSDELLVH